MRNHNIDFLHIKVGFISICKGSISADAVRLPVVFTVCVIDIGSSGVSS